jgi:hypothetical protein
MDEYKRSRMANTLKAAGVGTSPEVYAAYAMIKAGVILLGVIPCLFLLPLLSPVISTANGASPTAAILTGWGPRITRFCPTCTDSLTDQQKVASNGESPCWIMSRGPLVLCLNLLKKWYNYISTAKRRNVFGTI